MVLDVKTLFVVAVLVAAVIGSILIFAWLQNRGQRALLWWGMAHILAGTGVALLAMRGNVSDFWSIVIGNALLYAGGGMQWNAARVFDRRPPRPILIYAGSAAWIAACLVPGFLGSSDARVILSSIIIAAYSFATAYEIWCGRAERLALRWPAIAVLGFHGLVMTARIPLTMLLPLPAGYAIFASPWFGVMVLEGLLNAVALAVIILALTKERMELAHRNAAMLDPLTGIANRRAFLELGSRLLKARVRDRKPVAVILFDLDRFKEINDRFGHSAGDRVLKTFCRVARATLRADDLIGRLGGEEFAAILSGMPAVGAAATAERIRAAFEAAVGTVATTVSAGIVASESPGNDIELLLDRADEALYLAKANGRNRIEVLDFGSGTPVRAASAAGLHAPALVPEPGEMPAARTGVR
ncbi:MAG TPA: GGDEF domain-containing protein [Xanthobacteraceae bacterium]|nr:GGDEF domain-containing protein [Xanthobacteraceae bacterium]